MQRINVGSSLVAIAVLLTAAVMIPSLRAFAGAEGNITNPGAAPSTATPASPANTESPRPSRHEEEPARKHAEPKRNRAPRLAARRGEQSPQRATASEPAPRPVGVSIGVGGVSFGF